jgi:hypothetical protein
MGLGCGFFGSAAVTLLLAAAITILSKTWAYMIKA